MKLALGALSALLCLVPLAAGAQEAPRPDRTPAADRPFSDVPPGHWAFDAVEDMRKRGILRGYPPQPKPAPKRQAKPAKPVRPSRTRRA